MKLLFNYKTKSIVLKHNHEYVDMRNGESMETPKRVSLLKPFFKYNASKSINEVLVNKIKTLFHYENIEHGYRLEQNIYLTKSKKGEYHLSGYFPVYFFKGLIKYVEKCVRE